MKKIILLNLMAFILLSGFSIFAMGDGSSKSPVIASTKNLSTQLNDIDVKKGKLDEKQITFNFPNTNLSVFGKFMAKLCQKVLIGENLLQGNINIKSEEKLNLEDVKKLFKAVLYAQGLDIVETDIYMEIVQRSGSVVKVYKLNYLKAADLQKSLTEMFRMSFRTQDNPQTIQITAVDDANALIVLAPKNQQMEIEKAIKKMDVRTKQVLLNIMVVELFKKSEFGFGVDFNFSDNVNTVGISSGGTTKGTSTTPMTFTSSTLSSAGGYMYNKGQWFVNVQGIDKDTIIKTLSQPRVLTSDNQKAQIQIGKKQPYITSTASIGSGANGSSTPSVSSSISTKDIGTDIEITPRINSLNDVTLEVKLKITNITSELSVESGTTASDSGTNTASSNKVPNVGHRIINNTSNVMNGEVLVIGGLLTSQKTVTTTAPPILGDIPWIGWLFAKESEVFEQVELMVFISPSIIDTPEAAKIVTKKETDKLKDYDVKETVMIDDMLSGKKGLTDDVFNLFDYFNDGKYRTEQGFIPQPRSL